MISRYGFWGCIKLAFSFVITRLFYSPARLIRLPFDVRGRRYIRWGKNFTTGFGCRIEAESEHGEVVLKIGDNVQINDYVHITAMSKVVIGNDVLMASKIYISDCTHGSYSGDAEDSDPSVAPASRPISRKSVVIGDRVWLGEHVSVLPGTTIGAGSIIGANSVVTKDIPENVIAVGVPARPIKQYSFTSRKWEVFNPKKNV